MTDYMFVMDWTKEEGWKDARIVPEGADHHGSGMCNVTLCTGNIRGYESIPYCKAGKIQLFRPEMNAKTNDQL